jgi:hypothetical protein
LVVDVVVEVVATGGAFVVDVVETVEVSKGATVVDVVVATTTVSSTSATSGGTKVVDVDCTIGSGASGAATTTIDGSPRAVGASVTSVRTLPTAAAATTTATRVAAVHAATSPTILLMPTVCGKSLANELTEG